MRVNVYAEEMTDRIEIIEKVIEGKTFTAVRFYLYLPTTIPMAGTTGGKPTTKNVRGPFIHHAGDDDSAAVTFWGKRDLRKVLGKAIKQLDRHYAKRRAAAKKKRESAKKLRTLLHGRKHAHAKAG